MADMFLEREKPVAKEDVAPTGVGPAMDDATLLKYFKECKKAAFDHRWLWERGWMRNIHYVNNRQWIEYVRRSNEWRDVRLAKSVPKPVTNLLGEGVQALRAMFASVNIGANVRPNGADPKNVAVATMADDYNPVLHEEHAMDDVMNEADFWFIVCGNVFLHTFFEKDMRHGFTEVPFEECLGCKEIFPSDEIAAAKGVCPTCGAQAFQPATDPETGEPMVVQVPKGKGVTLALSPFEIAFKNSYARFEDVPEVIRMRWRSKAYYENHPVLAPQVKDVKWSKAPSEQALQLFRSLPYHNDMGVAPFLGSSGTGESNEEGAAEYEMWVRPCDQYPKGLVFRVLGDSNPIILHLEADEALPGPIPYVDADGQPVFPFTHAAFEQRGGRVYGTSPLDSVIHKQNSLNQLDSMLQMIVQRMSNPLWLIPKGSDIEKFTGDPGLVVKWNPLTVGGQAKPERVEGVGPNAGLFQYRQLLKEDIESGLGTFDILKGAKPTGVDSFSGLQLMVERSQSRFASAFKARGNLYKDWFKFALEIEREFGPEERQLAVMGPARKWTMQVFKNTNLQGSFSVIVEDGSQTPKTALGIRAAIQHLSQLNMIDPADPDQRYEVYRQFGLTKMSPALDIHMQAALRKQQAFEEWARNPAAQEQSLVIAEQKLEEWKMEVAMMQPPPPPVVQPAATDPNADPNAPPAEGAQAGAPAGAVDPAQAQAADEQQMAAAIPPPPGPTTGTPLEWKPWFDAAIHRQEFLKWANGDSVIELLTENPALETVLVAHLQDIEGALVQQAALMIGPATPQKPGGAGMAMANSNAESGGSQNASDNTAKPQA